MQVEAIYNQGHIQFVNPLRLKRTPIRLMVTVPDEAIEQQTTATPYTPPAQVLAQAQKMLDKYAAILKAPIPHDDDLPQLSAEYDERLEAIALRAQIRQEQGRAV